jgi:hypothetical protein
MDTSSPVADAYFDEAPFECEGTLKRLHFKYLEQESAPFRASREVARPIQKIRG